MPRGGQRAARVCAPARPRGCVRGARARARRTRWSGGTARPAKLASSGYAEPLRRRSPQARASSGCSDRAAGCVSVPRSIRWPWWPCGSSRRAASAWHRPRAEDRSPGDSPARPRGRRSVDPCRWGHADHASLAKPSVRRWAIAGSPLLGVKTGADEVFLVAQPGPATRPVVRGRDLRPWRATAARAHAWTHGPDGRPLAHLPAELARALEPHVERLCRRSDYRSGPAWRLFRIALADAPHRVIWPEPRAPTRGCRARRRRSSPEHRLRHRDPRRGRRARAGSALQLALAHCARAALRRSRPRWASGASTRASCGDCLSHPRPRTLAPPSLTRGGRTPLTTTLLPTCTSSRPRTAVPWMHPPRILSEHLAPLPEPLACLLAPERSARRRRSRRSGRARCSTSRRSRSRAKRRGRHGSPRTRSPPPSGSSAS